MIQVQIGIKEKFLRVLPSSEGLTERFALRYDSLAGLVGLLGLPDAFHCFQRLCAALTEEFQPGLLCLRNTLGGVVFSQASCIAE